MNDAPVQSSGDADDLLSSARSLSAGGEPAAALDACESAIAVWPDIREAYRLRLRLARALGDRARIADALEALVRHDADDAGSAAALGVLLCEAGEHVRAAALLRPLVARLDGRPGAHGDAVLPFATALAHLDAWDELRALAPVLDRLAAGADASSPYPPHALLAAARLAATVDRDRLLAEAAFLEASPRWLDAAAALSAVSAVIAAGRPFSMLRIDAASAALLAQCGRTAGRLLRPAERLALLDTVWPGWFGASPGEIGDGLPAGLGDALPDAIAGADIVCMPDAEAMRGDPVRFGVLAEAHRLVRFGTDAAFADPDLAAGMHRMVPYLRTALAGLPFLGFVGAHPAMFRKLAHFCGVPETGFVAVPREARFPVAEDGIDPRGFLSGGHAATLESLSVPFPGAVFLVSAPGPLGIAYAGRIKALGGIALDIGPLAAQWAGG